MDENNNLHQASFPSDHPGTQACKIFPGALQQWLKLLNLYSEQKNTTQMTLTQKTQTITIIACQLSWLRNIAAAWETNQRQCSRQRIVPIIEVWKIVKRSLPGRPLLTTFFRPSIFPLPRATERWTEDIVSPPSIGFPFVSIHNVIELQFTETTEFNCSSVHYKHTTSY